MIFIDFYWFFILYTSIKYQSHFLFARNTNIPDARRQTCKDNGKIIMNIDYLSSRIYRKKTKRNVQSCQTKPQGAGRGWNHCECKEETWQTGAPSPSTIQPPWPVAAADLCSRYLVRSYPDHWIAIIHSLHSPFSILHSLFSVLRTRSLSTGNPNGWVKWSPESTISPVSTQFCGREPLNHRLRYSSVWNV